MAKRERSKSLEKDNPKERRKEPVALLQYVSVELSKDGESGDMTVYYFDVEKTKSTTAEFGIIGPNGVQFGTLRYSLWDALQLRLKNDKAFDDDDLIPKGSVIEIYFPIDNDMYFEIEENKVFGCHKTIIGKYANHKDYENAAEFEKEQYNAVNKCLVSIFCANNRELSMEMFYINPSEYVITHVLHDCVH